MTPLARPFVRPAGLLQLSCLRVAAAALFSAATLSGQATGTPVTPAADTLALVWADEFDHEGPPDPAKWTFEHGFVRNQEMQWYQPENARCAGGLLVIEARRESRPNPNHQPEAKDWKRARPTIEYTSASVTTRDLHAWQYGRFEIRARAEMRSGLWPAIWTLGVAGRWPANGEIDLMEFYRDTILANLFWAGPRIDKPAGSVARQPLADFGGAEWAREFHVWRMEWDEQEVRLYVDEQLLNRTALTDAMRRDPDAPHPFRQPHYLVLNLALGSNGGDPATTEFPARFEIDYVRIYQRGAAAP